jgi:hypothetical protein
MPVKGIMYFEDEDDGLGWSEVFYLGTSTLSNGLLGMTAIAQARIKALSIDSSITYARVITNLPADNAVRPRQQRNAALTRLNLQGQANAGGQRSGDLPWAAVKVRWVSSDLQIFRTQLLRGLPDNWFDQGNDKIAQAALATFIPMYVSVLAANMAQIRHLNPVVPPATARVYSYVGIARGIYEGYTHRDTGRPFGLPRGRRPNRTVGS